MRRRRAGTGASDDGVQMELGVSGPNRSVRIRREAKPF